MWPRRSLPAHNFNPRSPYGERPVESSIERPISGFQSTLPIRGATTLASDGCMMLIISIHAPHTGSDPRQRLRPRCPANFNPRSPYGERPHPLGTVTIPAVFQSTLPMRGATGTDPSYLQKIMISIHAPHAGSDKD